MRRLTPEHKPLLFLRGDRGVAFTWQQKARKVTMSSALYSFGSAVEMCQLQIWKNHLYSESNWW
jgi:hypothetical protein